MNRYLADMHIHTALSPCAAPEMTPPAIVRAAAEAGLTLIAICDHNSAGNARAVQQAAEAARQSGLRELTVLAGMEITTAEEVHVLGLFGDVDAAETVSRKVRETLPEWRSGIGHRILGEEGEASGARPSSPIPDTRYPIPSSQSLFDADGQLIGIEDRMLSVASTFSLERAVKLVHDAGGLAVASHVDRPSFSVFSQLGLFPESAGLDAVEVSALCVRDPERAVPFDRLGLAAITSSDSHFLSDVGFARTQLWMESPTVAELRLALRNEAGRRWSR